MGDLNVDSLGDRDFENYLHRTMSMSEDLKPTFKFSPDGKNDEQRHYTGTSENDSTGISSFKEKNETRQIDNDKRFGDAVERLDYFLSWDGAMFVPEYVERKVVIHQASEGRDMSDHYGIWTRLATISQNIPDPDRVIKSVHVGMTKFWCLETTGGPGADEVKFTLRGVTEAGQQLAATTREYEEIEVGSEKSIDEGGLQFDDPGDFLLLSVSGKEIDSLSEDDDMGTATIQLRRSELQMIADLPPSAPPIRHALLQLTGDGGDYTVELEIRVG